MPVTLAPGQMASPLTVFVICSALFWGAEAYFADFGGVMGGRPDEPTCVDIPKNMSLCADIGYEKMRLPNLLEHDTLTEVQQQSGSWVPLLNVKCHPHTKLFLCSLFTPVCLESQIYPCRSLCLSVQTKCEHRMKTYGYHWPDMLSCDKFPEDNDMCIKPPDREDNEIQVKTAELKNKDTVCGPCQPVDTFENILDNFCRAKIVMRARVRKQKNEKVMLSRSKILKTDKSVEKHSRKKLFLDGESKCCQFQTGKKAKYLIMGQKVNEKGIMMPSFVLPWKKSKDLKKAVRMFKNLNCTDPNLFTPSMEDGTILPKISDEDLVKDNENNKTIEGKKKRKRKNKGKNNRKGPRKNRQGKGKKRNNKKKNKEKRKEKRREMKLKKKEQRRANRKNRKEQRKQNKEEKEQSLN